MKLDKYKIVFICVFVAYMLWGGYWVNICLSNPTDGCTGGFFATFFTGLPCTFILYGIGGQGIGSIMLLSLAGGIQWALLAAFLSHWIFRKKDKKEKEVS